MDSVDFDLDRPAQVNRGWSKRRQVVLQPGPSMWTATASLVVKVDDDTLDVEAFLIDLDGPINSFRLEAAPDPQTSLPLNPVVDGAIISATSLRLRGGIPSATLRRGHKMTINDQMVAFMTPVLFDAAGVATVTFKPPLRAAPADGTAVNVIRPTILVSLAASSVGWTRQNGGLTKAKQLVLEEAF
jgi:hypothetical protein